MNYGPSFYTVCRDAIGDVDCPKSVRIPDGKCKGSTHERLRERNKVLKCNTSPTICLPTQMQILFFSSDSQGVKSSYLFWNSP